ncbi:MAG: 2-amino-4-hydroxy-6-hydroxymethyldihydropteridine diphosphokinase [FCB group bacterium]|nr:2-amino-4-hydroxy-6-hydroxymethyldihydropteridine diphosphokinase [FCB group bacterium]
MGEIVYLSLGSNLGDRQACLDKATARLSQMIGLTLLGESSTYYSTPIDCAVNCPEFLNKVVKLECTLKPVQLLDNTERLEKALGRTEKGFNVDRVIDIDIILFGNRNFKNERLEIPHPRMAQRAFVLIPLCEIDPDLTDPQTKTSFAERAKQLGDQGVTLYKENADV